MKPFYVYILRCADASYYTGHTDDLDRRLEQHNSQDAEVDSYVSRRLPVELVFVECMGTRAEAFELNAGLKSGLERKKKR